MRRRRLLTKRINKSIGYQKTTLEGIIIYVDSTDKWCNVELANGEILYQIKFGEGVHPRLRRLEQSVTLIQTIGSRYGYIISGAGKRRVDSAGFLPKGTFKWNSGVKYNDGHQWS